MFDFVPALNQRLLQKTEQEFWVAQRFRDKNQKNEGFSPRGPCGDSRPPLSLRAKLESKCGTDTPVRRLCLACHLEGASLSQSRAIPDEGPMKFLIDPAEFAPTRAVDIYRRRCPTR